jgi:HEAT repeat protein
MYATVGIDKSDYYIDGFAALPRRDPEMLPILLRLSNDDDEQVRWAVAYYLGYLRDREEALAILRIMVNDPASQVRERAKTSLEGAARQK